HPRRSYSPRLRRRRGASLTVPRSPRLRRRRGHSLTCPLPPPEGALIPELLVDDTFERFVTPKVLQIAYEPLDVPARTILAGAGRMGGHHDIVHIPQRTVGRQGFPGRHVERGTVNLLILECPDQIIFDDDLTARDADEQGTRLHLGKGFGVEQSLCLLCEW